MRLRCSGEGDSEQRDTVASGLCFGRLLQGERDRGDKRASFVQAMQREFRRARGIGPSQSCRVSGQPQM